MLVTRSEENTYRRIPEPVVVTTRMDSNVPRDAVHGTRIFIAVITEKCVHER